MSKLFAVAYIVLVGLLMFGAVSTWRTRCESFGCMGNGIAWMAWVVLFVPTLGTGVVLRSLSSLGTSLAKLAKFALWLQVAMGAVLFVLWVSKSAA